MINENLKGQNMNNYEEVEEDQKEIRQNISIENNEQENYLEEGKIMNPMILEIEQLKEALVQANEKMKTIIQENNSLKLSNVDSIKELSLKDSIIDSNKQEISRLVSKISLMESEEELNKKMIKELNYKIIELNQQIESNKTLYKISQKIKKEKPEEIEPNYLLQINELNNKINEIEIKNSKLEFDNKNLLDKIDIINQEKKTEFDILDSLNKKKYTIYEKSIERLNEMINELLNEKQNDHLDTFNDTGIQNEIYKHFNEFEVKIKQLNDINSLIKNENQKLKNENEELSIIINGKETIIEKLQSNINKIENDFRQKISEINPINNELINNNENNETIEQLLNEQKKLVEENDILRNNYEQMTQGINEANELFLAKQKEYENTINAQVAKLKEYKFKISVLKIKVNELHSEIEFLQERQIKSQYDFFRQENLLSTIGKKKDVIDINFSPDQMKLTGTEKTPSVNPKINLNNNTDDINTNENN